VRARRTPSLWCYLRRGVRSERTVFPERASVALTPGPITGVEASADEVPHVAVLHQHYTGDQMALGRPDGHRWERPCRLDENGRGGAEGGPDTRPRPIERRDHHLGHESGHPPRTFHASVITAVRRPATAAAAPRLVASFWATRLMNDSVGSGEGAGAGMLNLSEVDSSMVLIPRRVEKLRRDAVLDSQRLPDSSALFAARTGTDGLIVNDKAPVATVTLPHRSRWQPVCHWSWSYVSSLPVLTDAGRAALT
jgi:hypothetical protein